MRSTRWPWARRTEREVYTAKKVGYFVRLRRAVQTARAKQADVLQSDMTGDGTGGFGGRGVGGGGDKAAAAVHMF